LVLLVDGVGDKESRRDTLAEPPPPLAETAAALLDLLPGRSMRVARE